MKKFSKLLGFFLGLVTGIVYADVLEIQIQPGGVNASANAAVVNQENLQNFSYKPKKMATLYDKNLPDDGMQSIPIFNTWFRTNVRSQEELTTAIAQLISRFYNNLRQCIPGKYNYPQPNILFGLRNTDNVPQARYFYTTSIIYGAKDNHCIVENIVEKNNQALRTLCFYSVDSLSFYTDQKAKAASINYLRYEPADLDKIQQIASECKVVLFNQPLS